MEPSPRPGAAAAAAPRLLIEETGWRRAVPALARRVGRAARLAGAATVVLASDRTVKRLNARHRGRNRPTNVLSFPPLAGASFPQDGGEIVLALGVVRREARAAGRSVGDHLAHLVIHGGLHLAGHDHHGAGEAKRMEMAEARLLHRLGVANPWRRA